MATTELRIARAMDYPDGAVARAGTPAELNLAPILGAWRNTNSRTTGICRAALMVRRGTVWMRVWAADPVAGQHDWGETALTTLYADGPYSERINGYTTAFDLGHARTTIQANMNHGLTILAAFTTFEDGSGRANYLSREFYARMGE